ncbi:MAG: cyclodeaminase/cyclohydrolase family protein [Desulfobacterales bacterium]
MLANLKITDYLEKAAAGTAVPGGGSVAALNAALAAGLTEMVANLTIGKKGYEAVAEEMNDIAGKSTELREKLTVAIDRDAEAYSEVMAAFKLPKATDQEKGLRSLAVQKAFKHAALVPLEVANHAVEVIDLAGRAVDSGNKNAVTDGLVAAMNARTAALAALYNVKINLGSIEDDEFVKKLTREINDLEQQAKSKEQKILANVMI